MVLAFSCSKVRRSPGRAYMPDMSYSRAYETYASTDNPEAGRGELQFHACGRNHCPRRYVMAVSLCQ